ncbi:hypothetical protein BDZ97DRAFT_368454 [Flammula alnicola]|nr:hypothetical protein BDZ97DRAFT_368454 [Flammula alnicola]
MHAKSLDIQLRALIIEPFFNLTPHPHLTPTMIIDGLDEREAHDIRRLILTLSAEALITHKVPRSISLWLAAPVGVFVNLSIQGLYIFSCDASCLTNQFPRWLRRHLQKE